MTDELVYDFTEIVYGARWVMDIPDGEYLDGVAGRTEYEPVVIWNRLRDPETGDEWAMTMNERDEEHSLS